jgi:hypothetical protein
MARSGWSVFLPTLFTLIAIVLAIIVLAAGVNNQLSQIYYLKASQARLERRLRKGGLSLLTDRPLG